MYRTELFPAAHLPWYIQTDARTGRRRKVLVEDLASCPLREMVQWNCEPTLDGTVYCRPVERFFRMCKQVTVEVTEFEAARRRLREAVEA